ncbi:MAG: hypothetical protein ABIF06_00260 [bacterium]
MKKYLSTLKDKPHQHRKRFALIVSSVFTLAIFAGWSLVTFGGYSPNLPVAQNTSSLTETSPFGTLRSTFAAAFASIRGNVDEVKKGIQSVNLDQYTNENTIKNDPLNSYDQ